MYLPQAGRRMRRTSDLAEGQILASGRIDFAPRVKSEGHPWDGLSQGTDPGGIVSGLRELGYTVELMD